MYTLNDLLKRMMETRGASDLVLSAGTPPKLRIYRKMVPLNLPNLTPEDTERLCFSILDPEQIETFKDEKELDTAVLVDDVGRFRVNLFRQRNTYGLVARCILEDIISFEKLRVPKPVQAFAKLVSGLVLVTGPTGSGKSCTLAAILDHINQTRPCHIFCIEDPIEVIHKPIQATINQREVGTDTNSYNEALRRVLRQAPDVIMIGEIRDRESAQTAITLAETGHLTFATLHTRGAISSINRLIDMFPAEQIQQIRSQLAASLAGVTWQQLLPDKDDDGLVLACEIMVVTPAIRALILNGNTHEIISLLQTGKKYGMCTMDQAIKQLKAEGLINGEEATHDIFEAIMG